jgi:hypothetical protein
MAYIPRRAAHPRRNVVAKKPRLGAWSTGAETAGQKERARPPRRQGGAARGSHRAEARGDGCGGTLYCAACFVEYHPPKDAQWKTHWARGAPGGYERLAVAPHPHDPAAMTEEAVAAWLAAHARVALAGPAAADDEGSFVVPPAAA